MTSEGMSELFVLQVLAADVNIGYEEMVNTRVQKVNGKQVKNLLELVKLIGGCTEEFLRLDLEYNQVRQGFLLFAFLHNSGPAMHASDQRVLW